MTLLQIRDTIGMSIVVITLCFVAALLWVGVGGLIGCALAGVLAGLALVLVERNGPHGGS
jgi:hypothetical protein